MRVSPWQTIARIRAQMLHILHEIGQEKCMFRLRFNGEFLKDAFLISDYNIVENAVLKMIPVADIHEVSHYNLLIFNVPFTIGCLKF